MNFVFNHRKISGLAVIVPANERSFIDEMANFAFPPARSLKLKEVMGYDKHRLVDGPVCTSDLVVFGLEYIFEKGLIGRDDFDAMILVTQSPDYFMPPTSNVIQGKLGLKKDLFCLDINQGCAGFLVGLIQGYLLLDQPAIRKVLLINADVMSRKVSSKDRNSYPLIGDAASIAVLEKTESDAAVYANLRMDGSRCEALMIPAGGFRLPSSAETAILREDADGNMRSKDDLCMDGSAVFNFVQSEVPPMIEEILKAGKMEANEVDAFIFHQPNRFMLQKLADRIGVAHSKMPSNIVEHFGNSSGVTVPLAMAFNFKERILAGKIKACLAGFGVGLTWSSALTDLGPLDFCELIEYR